MTSSDMSKAEKERLLDEKIKRLKMQNAQTEQRFREVDRDKTIAEHNKSSITTAPKPKNEPASPPERPFRGGGGGKNNRRQSDDHDTNSGGGGGHSRSSTGGGGPAAAVRGGGRAQAAVPQGPPDPNGPPPDPSYRYLADRMREEDEAVISSSGSVGKRNRGGSGSGGAGNEGSAHSRLGGGVGGRSGRGGGGGGGGGKVRDRLHSNRDNRQQQQHRNSNKESDDDDCFIVSETDRKGNMVNFYGGDHSASKAGTGDNRKGQSQQHGRKGGMESSSSPRVSAGSVSSSAVVSPPSAKQQPAPKIKSLFDDDDEEEYYFPERWKGKEHHPKLFDSSQIRRIEQTSSGKLMVTRTIDPVARLETEFAKPSQSKLLEQQQHKEFMAAAGKKFVAGDDGSGGGKVLVSDSEWQCSDPACRHLNAKATSHCQQCKLAFSRSNDYKKNLACDKYKQEFRRQPAAAVTAAQQPVVDMLPAAVSSDSSAVTAGGGASYTNGGPGMVDPVTAAVMPAHQIPAAAHHHQFYPNSVPTEVSGGNTAWGQSPHHHGGTTATDFGAAAGGEWAPIPQPHHHDTASAAASSAELAANWPAAAALQQQQQEMMQQGYGIMMGHHHPQMPPGAAAAAGFTTSSTYFEHHAAAAVAARQLDAAAAVAVNHHQYYNPTTGTSDFINPPASAAQFVDHASFSGFAGPQQQQAPNQFNPVAQAFVPTSSTEHPATKKAAASVAPLYQTPPPLLTGGGMLNRPPPPSNKSSDPNLLVSLNSPPKPLRINHLDPSKHIRSSRNSAEDSSPGSANNNQHSVNSRLSYKNTQQTKSIPPRFGGSKSREQQYYSAAGSRSGGVYKPPSLMEMQSGTLKKTGGGLAVPAPPDGAGLLVFGTSNVVNNLDTFKFSRYIGDIPVKLVPAMRLELFQTVLTEVDPARDWMVLIHGLGNDARNIALKQKSESAKVKEVDEVANLFCDLIEDRILSLAPHIRVLISLLLPRYDFEEKPGLSNPNTVRKVINVTITDRFYKNPRVELINSDDRLALDTEESRNAVMGSDGYHLTNTGFKRMVGNWIDSLMRVVRDTFPHRPLAPCEHSKDANVSNNSNVNSLQAPNSTTTSVAATTTAQEQLLLQQQLQQPPPPLLNATTAHNSLQEEDDRLSSSATGTTVPDPFGAYTAPVAVVSPGSRKLPPSDDELDDVDEDGIPSLETVEQPTAITASNNNNALLASEEENSGSVDATVSPLTNPLLMEQPADGENPATAASALVAEATGGDFGGDSAPSSTGIAAVTYADDTASKLDEKVEDSSRPVPVAQQQVDGVSDEIQEHGATSNSGYKSEKPSSDGCSSPTPSVATNSGVVPENGLKDDHHQGDSQPATAVAPLKPVFRLGAAAAESDVVNGVGGGEFIDDEYCGVSALNGTACDPLPSMINCSGPESLNLASGIFLEDSYIDTTNHLEGLSIGTDTKQADTAGVGEAAADKCKPLADAVGDGVKLRENGNESLIET